MKTKLFTLFLVLVASVGTMLADVVKIGDLYYDLKETSLTAVVTSQPSSEYGHNYESLTTITIPDSVEYNSKFYSVTSIGSAFKYCPNLTSITLPSSISSIDEESFYGSNSLEEINIALDNPNYCSSDGILFNKDQTGLIRCPGGKQGSYTIPSSVTCIWGRAFFECHSITSIIVPSSVISIGQQAFGRCYYSGFTIDILNETPPTAGYSLFYDRWPSAIYVPCGTLETYQEDEVWRNYKTQIKYAPNPYLHLAVNNANAGTVNHSQDLSICSDNTAIEAIPNYGYHFVKWNDGITTNPRTIVLTQDTTFTAEFAIDRNGKCGDYLALSWTYDTISRTLTISGEGAFNENMECGVEAKSAMTHLVIEEGITSIGESAFYGCSGLTSVAIGNSVKSIGKQAFRGCTDLTEITIPESVTSIGMGAFRSCSSLTSLKVLSKDIQVESVVDMFALSTALKYISAPACMFDIQSDYISYPSYFPQKLDSIEVTNGELSENALWMINLSRKTLKSINLSGTTHTDLVDEAFKAFYNLENFQLPTNLTHIGYMSIAECVKLKYIIIPASVTEIADRAFEDCRSIETITFGDIQPSHATYRKNVLASLNSQLQRIGNWAFYNAHELQHLEIPEGVTEIGDGAFYGCVYLEDLVLPSSVQQIGDNCFALCTKLDKIVVNSVTPPTIAAKTFYDVKRQIPVYVPDDCVGAYKGDPYWGEFDIQSQSNMPQGINEIIDSKSLITNKVLKDGCILILHGDKTYTVTGAEIK